MKSFICKALALTVLGLLVGMPAAAELTPEEQFGKELYFDSSLSSPNNQSCAFCHEERSGFSGHIPGINKQGAVYPGAERQRFGNRRPPTASYAGDSPVFDYVYDMDEDEWLFAGGMFWDGRATGWVTGDPLADQAMGPYLNPVEQNLPSEEAACMIVEQSKYAYLYEVVYGEPLDCSAYDADGHLRAYKNFALAVAAFERSVEVSPFNSKFDYVMAGEAEFTEQEAWGLQLFNGKGRCSACHPAPLFTDFTYDNLGVPKNPENPFYRMDTVYVDGMPINPEGAAWVDPGLAGFLETLPQSVFDEWGLDKETAVAESFGKHKVPTLRNADKRPGPGFAKSYMHNGSLKSLEEVVSFYNSRDAMIAAGMIVPEVWENMNEDELGDLGLTADEEAAIVAFMQTLSDGYAVKGKGKGKGKSK
ncbi:Cytochrome c peroxidase [Geoalkalibacter ferrihydriticus]|uniref:Cytochrome c peroxidase n=1 Tax=Geoalkalibacter ferrihydriticus TaxID=392333 RepID=A0A1G9IS30_9BACT|nr:cytochrome c peroxidase [Geoalkalibacter ferrihydriticus]SDL28129.1 Cytochrome c peroxidase [Geoalkalibacter ferrihydriticus]